MLRLCWARGKGDNLPPKSAPNSQLSPSPEPTLPYCTSNHVNMATGMALNSSEAD